MDTTREYIVDADGHVCEPAELWTKGLPDHLKDRGIRLRWNESTGFDECLVDDQMATDRGLVGLGNAGESFDNFGQGRHYEDLNPAGFDAGERVKVLDSEGIDLAVIYPGLGLKLGGIQDPELAVACCRVYNDWLAEWTAVAPDRLRGVGALPLQDPAAAAVEAHRIRDLGLVGGFARPNAYLDRPFHHKAYTPVWEALEETGLPLALHPAGLADMPGASRGLMACMAPGTHHALILLFDQQMTLSNLTYGGVLERHPDLKVIVLECGGGWIAHWMDRLGEFEESYGWTTAGMSLTPEEYFRRQCWISFDPGERTAGVLGPLAGGDRFIWASDFPHSDAKYPGVVDELRERNDHLDPESRAGLFGRNALDMYGIEVPRVSDLDLLIRGGRVVDGTGAPVRMADVGVRAGRVVAVDEHLDGTAARELDADGRLVTPGFVDVHTHYDAQLHWDPTASPASWHGVTTLLTGNCGFTFAPCRPDDLEWLLLMLSRVEGMSAEALASGVDFPGGTLGDFLDNLEGRVGVNVGANVGHCALRRHVLGDDASVRAATDDEIAAMQDLLRGAFRDGAVGFTSSQLEIHQAHDGRGVPSNYAAAEELVALAGVLKEFGRGQIEFIPRSFLVGYDDEDRALIRAMAEASGRPVHLNTLTQMPHAPDGWSRSLEFAEQAIADGLEIHPMFASNRQGAHFQLGSTFLFDEMPSFRTTLTLPPAERAVRLRDPAVREQMRQELADPTGRSFVVPWSVLRVEQVQHERNRRFVDRSVTEVAEAWDADPLDAFLDLSLDEDLETQFVLAAPPDPRRRAATETLIHAPFVMPGSSDGGAHLLSFCGADYTTRLLTEWVPDVLSLEEAVARLTSVPAAASGVTGRGRLAPGAAADVLVIDESTLGTPDAPRYVEDMPAGSGRFVTDATGYDAVIVNGEVLLDQGEWTGATPGQVLRGGGS